MVIQSSFSQMETLTQPTSSGVFETDCAQGIRNREKYRMQALSLLHNRGVSYQLPLNASKLIAVSTRTFVCYWLTPVVKNLQWSVSACGRSSDQI